MLGFLVALCLGVIYAYSILRVHLEEYFREATGRDASSIEMQAGYMLFLFVYSLSVMAGGWSLERLGPKRTLRASSLLLLSAWTLSSLASTPLQFAIPYGILGGLGAGLAFNVIVTVAVSWFPERSGFASGLTIMGFGLSPLIAGNAIDFLVEYLGIKLALITLGLTISLIILCVSIFIELPLSRARVSSEESSVNSPSRRLISLWILFFSGTAVGLSAIGVSKPAGLEVAEKSGFDPVEVSGAITLLVSLFSVFNALGRPLFGYLVDRIGVRASSLLAYTLAGGAIALAYIADDSLTAYAVSYSILWATLGGWLAIASGATRIIFGTTGYSRLFGYIFTAYGAGALVGNTMLSIARDVVGDYSTAILALAPLLALGALTALLYPPRGAR